MRINEADKEIKIFTISPRTYGLDQYWREAQQTLRWCEQYGCTGMLIFTGNDVYVDPWSVAQVALEHTARLSPLIAVNPVYMHPFTAARMISSFAHLYGRRVFLNMVTGTALSHLEALGDSVSHDERYARLQEYILIIKGLLCDSRPVTLDGRYYKVSNLQMPTRIPMELQPQFVLAGQSDAAMSVCKATGALGMNMLQSTLENTVIDRPGVHFGIVTRPNIQDAWKAARRLFPTDEEGRDIVELSMKNTDSAWKARMKFEADQPNVSDSGYWLEPFRGAKADCPYFVGSYERTASLIEHLVQKGIELFTLDIPAVEEEYHHTEKVFSLAQDRSRR